MKIDVRSHIAEINRRKSENADALEYIKAKEEECVAETKDAKDLVEWNNMVINLFEKTPVIVNLEDIIEELANIYGVDKENMDVRLKVQQCVCGEYSEVKSRYSHLMAWIRNAVKDGDSDFGRIVVEVYNGDMQLLKFIFHMNLKAVQRDGKEMREHMQIVKLENSSSKNGEVEFYTYKIDDYRNLVAKYKVIELMWDKELSYLPAQVKEAILNIADRESADMSQEGMSAK